ncbi:hypothetical protein NEFER03_1022 [Nematocida sp. LUAm3]|nr:hypothetical protein NEFER03_1022 [Nematocida sp. LUAm3]KAI5175374.1 hypothetical protein NEFER02_1303 [Nematocida sp. LUAm2]KAI5177669.1 hypothetical protein NEFER01_0893 [Nematocida sp. LUAm1]
MKWSILLLSQWKERRWEHLASSEFLRIEAEIEKRALTIYTIYFGEEEVSVSFNVLHLYTRAINGSIGIFGNQKRIQLRLANEASAARMHDVILRIQKLFSIYKELRRISRRYK